MVSDRDRHIIAFGCDSELNPGVQDPLLIRFSSQESLTDWATRPDNTAGELRLDLDLKLLVQLKQGSKYLFLRMSLCTLCSS